MKLETLVKHGKYLIVKHGKTSMVIKIFQNIVKSKHSRTLNIRKQVYLGQEEKLGPDELNDRREIVHIRRINSVCKYFVVCGTQDDKVTKEGDQNIQVIQELPE